MEEVKQEQPKVLNKVEAIPEGLTPTGRKLGVRHVRGFGMYEVAFVDGKGGEIPDELDSKFTSYERAQRYLESYLLRFWEKVDSKKKPLSNAVSR